MDIAGSNPRVATDYFPIVPSDTALFDKEIAGIYVGGTGSVTVVKRNGSTCLFSGCPVGLILPVACVGVKAAGTSASLLVGLV